MTSTAFLGQMPLSFATAILNTVKRTTDEFLDDLNIITEQRMFGHFVVFCVYKQLISAIFAMSSMGWSGKK
jgi:hypothetical protein